MSTAIAPSLKPLWANFTYFPHQLDGIQWMLDKEINGTLVPTKDGSSEVRIHGGFQCDDMGLGKTIQIASVIVNNPCRRTLLLAPLAMIDTWSQVLRRAGCIVYEVQKNDWEFMNEVDEPIPRYFIRHRPAIYITNYEKLTHKKSLFQREWDRVVLDEAHKIRNGDGFIAKEARKIVAPLRWVVTGTPLVNSLKDVVSLLAFLGVPHSKLWRWEPRYIRLLPNIVIHRSLNSLRNVIKGAPPIPEVHELELPFTTEAEEEFYFGVQGETEKYSLEGLSSVEAFVLLLRLRQISVHPQVYINAKRRKSQSYKRDDWVQPSTKLEKIGEIIENDNGRLHKYIIFCQFNDEMVLIRDYLLSKELIADENILMYNGSLTQMQRTAILARSKETTEKTVMLLQLQAGGVGLNLQEYDRVIFVSPWWTSALMDQAVARAVRMGQTEVVKVYHLRLKAEKDECVAIDRLVNAKAEEKRKMLEKLFQVCASTTDTE